VGLGVWAFWRSFVRSFVRSLGGIFCSAFVVVVAVVVVAVVIVVVGSLSARCRLVVVVGMLFCCLVGRSLLALCFCRRCCRCVVSVVIPLSFGRRLNCCSMLRSVLSSCDRELVCDLVCEFIRRQFIPSSNHEFSDVPAKENSC